MAPAFSLLSKPSSSNDFHDKVVSRRVSPWELIYHSQCGLVGNSLRESCVHAPITSPTPRVPLNLDLCPANMKAIKIQPGGKAAVVDAPLPRLRPDYVLVKTVAVALNPVDWKHIGFVPGTEGCTAGSDFAGVVRKVGAKVTTLKPGDRVAGWTHGGNINNREDGSFADYVVAKEGIMLKIPERVSFAEAATLGVGISTICQGLYQSLRFSLPTEPRHEHLPLLVYGASTASGALAVQFAKMCDPDQIPPRSPISDIDTGCIQVRPRRHRNMLPEQL